jgi:hypothetical protein
VEVECRPSSRLRKSDGTLTRSPRNRAPLIVNQITLLGGSPGSVRLLRKYFTQLCCQWGRAHRCDTLPFVRYSLVESSLMSNPLQAKEHRDYDPRIGDEDVSTPQSDLRDKAQSSPIPHSVRPSPELEYNDYCGKGKGSATSDNLSQRATTSRFELPDSLRWIPDNWTLSKWMPAIRCAVAEWTSLVLLVVKPTTQAMGQAGFLVLVGRWTLHQ